MKNKKKLISIIVIVLIVSVFCLFGVLFTVKSKMNAKESVSDYIIEETTENAITDENEQLENTLNMEVAEAVTEEITEQPKVNDTQPVETSQASASKSNSNDTKNKTATVTRKANTNKYTSNKSRSTISSTKSSKYTTKTNYINTNTNSKYKS